MSALSIEEVARRGNAMRALPERDRSVLIALGVLQSRVIDARHRFDRDFGPADLIAIEAMGLHGSDFFPPVVTETVFEGVFGPGDCA